MYFERIIPGQQLKDLIECYWIIESDDTTPLKQKIIPDGFPEIIFHYRDTYRININKKWEIQKKVLLAGQIKKFFFLKNTGASGVFGIKFKPAAITQLFGLSMDQVADKVVPLSSLNKELKALKKGIDLSSHKAMVASAEYQLQKLLNKKAKFNVIIEKAIELVFNNNGAVTVTDICRNVFITERQLQRLFKKYVGLSPKFYSRIIRFNYIFQLMKEGKTHGWI